MAHDPFNAFVAVTPDAAAAAAGLRVAVKDMIGVAGMAQPAGVAARADIVAPADAAAVRRLRAAGHTIVGVTVSDAAGFGTMTDAVRHPIDPSIAVGGSSGGSAAAVAGGLADLGLGTDTGGSVRIPAAYCGLFAFKPSAGRVPMDGVLPLCPALDTVGVMAATAATLVAGVRALLDLPARLAERQPLHHVGVAMEALAVADAAVAVPFTRVCDAVGGAPFHNPVNYDAMADASGLLTCADAYHVHRTLFEEQREGFPPLAAEGLAIGARLSPKLVASARREMAAAARAWRTAMAEFDLLILPTLPMAPAARYAREVTVRGARWPITNANIRFCQFANVAGFPVVVAPVAGQSLQFVGRVGADEALLVNALALAERLECILG